MYNATFKSTFISSSFYLSSRSDFSSSTITQLSSSTPTSIFCQTFSATTVTIVGTNSPAQLYDYGCKLGNDYHVSTKL
ncbi:hypothetical protein PanWU01x14_097860 [Parasponia andersonii]|uniref:Uncharacterized protein n=1 Tax=Parasponia andersonii TaxID=3476 RepID=A0A2P5D4N0_PARAD|nr:hypothetical protein PanWU01x14_097860 [Parasponia andersonii]